MKICILTTSHKVTDARVFHKEAMSLKERYGADEICMICQHEKERDRIDGLQIYGVPPRASRSLTKRFSVMREMYHIGLAIGADIYHTHEPDAAFVAWKLKRKLGCKAVYDSHEVYPDMFAMNFSKYAGLNKLVRGIVFVFERRISRHMDLIIATNQYGVDYFRDMLGESAHIILIDNVPSLTLFPDAPRHTNVPPLLIYEGNLSFKRAMRELMEALHILKQRGVRFRLRFMGRLLDQEKPWLEEYIRVHELDDVFENLGWVDYEKLGAVMSGGDIGVLTLQNVVNYYYSTPNKLYNYMRYGMALVAPDFPEIARVVNEASCGLLIDSENSQDIANKLQTLIEDTGLREQMGQRGKAAVLEKYNWEAAEAALFAAYERMGVVP